MSELTWRERRHLRRMLRILNGESVMSRDTKLILFPVLALTGVTLGLLVGSVIV